MITPSPSLQLTGMILIITGAVVQAQYSQYMDFLGSKFFNAPTLLVVVGLMVFGIAFFGCCGAIKENYCMTMTFSVLLSLVFLLEFGAGIAAYTMKGELRSTIETNMEKGMLNFGKEHYKGVTETWNIVQHDVINYLIVFVSQIIKLLII